VGQPFTLESSGCEVVEENNGVVMLPFEVADFTHFSFLYSAMLVIITWHCVGFFFYFFSFLHYYLINCGRIFD
jgi:hypothetical protein